MREFAPAKLNLYLHILGKDQRGYHLLDSLVAFADVGDELRARAAPAFALSIEGPFAAGLESGEDNLITRAAHRLAIAAGRTPAVALTLRKALPVASGIGGGSADAAATLRLLCRMWGLDPAGETVREVARSLGSDVPVCVASRPCFMGGTGERLDGCPSLPPAFIVLANPGVACPTKEVFAARAGPFAPEGRFDIAPRDASELAGILERRGNGLAAAAIGVRPEISTVLAALEATRDCLLVRMLGSGATCLALYAAAAQARDAAETVRKAHGGWWVKAGKLLDSQADWGHVGQDA